MKRFRYSESWKSFFLFILAASFLIGGSLLLHDVPVAQPYDSADYLKLADAYVETGRFDFFSYPHTFRGYLFPLLLCIIRSLFIQNTGGGTNTLIFLMNSVFVAWFAVWGVKPFSSPNHRRRAWLPILAFCALILIFWNDLLSYALTDFYGIVWLWTAAVLLVQALRNAAAEKHPLVKSVLTGILVYAAYNLRPNLQFALLALLGFVVVWTAFKPERKRLLMLAGFVAGMALAAWPQMLLNAHHTGSYSPLVPTDQYSDHGLMLAFLNEGFWIRRYETYIGDPAVFRSGPMIFRNEQILSLLEAGGIEQFASVWDYIRFVLTHPFGFCQ